MNIQTFIERITVFKSAALVTRTGKIPKFSLVEGTIKFYIEGLPLILNDGSLRASVKGKSSWAVRNIQIEIDKKEKEKKENWEEKLKTLEKELELLNVEIMAIEEGINFINTWSNQTGLPGKIKELKELYREKVEKGGTFFKLDPYLGFVKTCNIYLEKLHKKQEELNWKSYEKRREINSIKEILATPLYNEEKDETLSLFYKNLIVTLGCMDRKEIEPEEIEISYIIEGPLWLPVYKLYIEDNYKKVKLVAGAQVAQNTGEDWDRAKLSFSSALLERKTQIPPLPSIRIGRAQAGKPPSFKKKLPSSPDIYKDYYDWLTLAGLQISERKSPYKELLDTCMSQYNEVSGVISDMKAKPMKKETMDFGKADKALYKDVMAFPSVQKVMKEEGAPAPPECLSMSEVCDESSMTYRSPMIKVDLLPSEKKSFSLLGGVGSAISDTIHNLPPIGFPFGGGAGGIKVDLLPVEKKKFPSSSIGIFQREEPERELFRPQDIETKKIPDYMNYELTGIEESIVEYRGFLRVAKSIFLSEKIAEPERIVFSAIEKAMKKSKVKDFGDVSLLGRIESFQFVFEGKGRASIPSDGLPHTVDLISNESPSSLEYTTVPVTDEQVFRRIVIENPFEALPEGPVQVFIDNAYSMTTILKSVGKGGKAVFPLGVEQNIKVARNTSFHQGEKGMMGGLSVAEHTVEIKLKSNLSEPVTVEVMEGMPIVPEYEKDINIKIIKSEPESEEVEFAENEEKRQKSIRKWKLPLQPGADGFIKLEYVISLPSKMEIQGGNRRV